MTAAAPFQVYKFVKSLLTLRSAGQHMQKGTLTTLCHCWFHCQNITSSVHEYPSILRLTQLQEAASMLTDLSWGSL